VCPTDPPPPPTAPEVIARRRTTRRFDPDRPVAEDLLARILGLATFAPSDDNLQPWRFLVVRRASNRRRLRACAWNDPRVTEAPVVVVVLGYQTPDRSHLGLVVATMRALGAVTPEAASELSARASRAMARMPDRAAWATRAAAFAAAGLMTAAESLGVGSALLKGCDPVKVRDAFGVPDDHSVCCLIALGYAAEVPPFPGRLGLAEVCYEEHFGQPWKPKGVDGRSIVGGQGPL